METIDTTTPPGAVEAGDAYDWRNESWVTGASMAATLIGMRIAAAFCGPEDDEFDSDQAAEDARVRVLVNPSLAARFIADDEAIRFRVAHAIAQCIDRGLAEARARGLGFDVPASVFTE